MSQSFTSMDARTQPFTSVIKLRTYTHLLEDKDLQEIFEILDKACRRKDVEFPDEELVIGTIPHVTSTYPEPQGDPSY